MLEHRQGNIALYLIAFSQQIRGKKDRVHVVPCLHWYQPRYLVGWKYSFTGTLFLLFFFKEWFAHIFLPSLSAGSNK